MKTLGTIIQELETVDERVRSLPEKEIGALKEFANLFNLNIRDYNIFNDNIEGYTNYIEASHLFDPKLAIYLENDHVRGIIVQPPVGESYKIRELPIDILSKFENLSYLILSHLELQEIPTRISELTNLCHLALSLNNIRKIPDEIVGLTNLMILDLGYNKIREIPPCISLLKELKMLDLENNNINKLPDELKELTNLTKLKVAGNKIKNLQEWAAVLIEQTYYISDYRERLRRAVE